jgi:hypothetical protein
VCFVGIQDDNAADANDEKCEEKLKKENIPYAYEYNYIQIYFLNYMLVDGTYSEAAIIHKLQHSETVPIPNLQQSLTEQYDCMVSIFSSKLIRKLVKMG